MTLEGVGVVALVAIVPVVALMLSAFVKTSVVLALLRNALGAPQAPPGLVVTGLALLITVFVMAPLGQQVLNAIAPAPTTVVPGGVAPSPAPGGVAPSPAPGGVAPSPAPGGVAPSPAPGGVAPSPAPGGVAPSPAPVGAASAPAAGSLAPALVGPMAVLAASDPLAGRELPRDGAGWAVALGRASVPVRAFLVRHAHAADRATFVGLARELRGAEVADDDLLALSAAFVTSELTEAFAIAFLVFLPFLVLDLVVGIGLSSAGLTTVSPAAVALPLKLVLFVAVDGWRLLVEGLIRGYA